MNGITNLGSDLCHAQRCFNALLNTRQIEFRLTCSKRYVFQQHDESSNALKSVGEAVEVMARLLARLPDAYIDRIEQGHELREKGVASFVDILVHGDFGGKPKWLAIEFKENGQPRNVRAAADQLRRYLRHGHRDAVPIVMAPYLSPRAREECRFEEVGYLDFAGNALIAFDNVYIEREVGDRPPPERRILQSLYKPKAARILRTLLADPARSWRVADLADTAKVSTGMVSVVGKGLRKREWAELTDDGLALTAPGELLDDWADNYIAPVGREYRYYTPFHDQALIDRLRELPDASDYALASYSAAAWLAPFTRHPTTYLYATEQGREALVAALDLAPAVKGANVAITVPRDRGVLDDVGIVSDGLVATSPVQTYLDLMHAGERGAEGAEHLRRELLDWPG